MLAEQLLSEGNLSDALISLQDHVKREPTNAKYRVFLFQLLAVLGQWERALTQLKVASDLDAANLLMMQTYREAIQCEALRATVFSGKHTPLIFGDPQRWVALVIEALQLDVNGHSAEAISLRHQAFELAPASRGAINGIHFEWIADADSRLGPLLEAVVNGKYYWIPFQQIQKIEIDPPTDLRDLVWMPVVFTWANGGVASGLIPTLYPGSELSDDNGIRLARKTEWTEYTDEGFKGLGQRLFATDVEDYALMDVRTIEIQASDCGP